MTVGLFYPGEAERTKLAVHAALGTLATLCASYNAIAFALRGDAHLARNVVIYGSLAVLEYHQARKHREGVTP